MKCEHQNVVVDMERTFCGFTYLRVVSCSECPKTYVDIGQPISKDDVVIKIHEGTDIYGRKP